MPTRNRRDLLARAVDSVLTQSYENLELFVADDGSTDGTPDFLQQRSAEDHRLKFFRNETSRGAPYSRNLAIAAASGRWITGIDDDDTFHPERVAAFVAHWQMMEKTDAHFSCLFSQDVYDYGTRRTNTRKSGNIEWLHLFEYNGIGNQVFTLTERLRAVGMFDEGMPAWQDMDLFVRVLKQFGPAKLLDAPLYTLSLEDRPDRISRQKKERILMAFERLSGKHAEAEPHNIQSLFLQIFGELYGFKPDLDDVRRFAGYGWNFANAKRFLKAFLK